jgi:pectin methylesterase-like acyl-CoA thioesterase
MGVLQKSRITTTTIALAALMLFTAGRAMATTRVVFQGDESCIDEDFPQYSTITAAVDASYDGDTIEVCDGTYKEAFTIFQNDLTLESVNQLGATIQAPYHLTEGGAIIEVIGNEDYVAPFAGTGDGGGVVISGFIITGPGAGSESRADTCELQDGILVHEDAVATISNNEIVSIRDNPLSGCQTGFGIRVGEYTGNDDEQNDPGTGTLTGNTISDYQKGGIWVDGDGSSATITENTITGAGKTNVIAQNGIQISNTTFESTITDNSINDNFFDNKGCLKNGGCYRAVGVLELNAGAKGDTAKILKHNTFSKNQFRVVVVLPKP